MYNYLYISYDALTEFTSNRFYQSADFEQSQQLLKLLRGDVSAWSHPKLFATISKKQGLYIHSERINKKRGVLYDFSSFKGFETTRDADIINIFQKVAKYAVKYFDSLPLVSNERNIDEKLALVYPFPFIPQKEVDKVYIDKNSSSQNRAEQNYLTVFFYGHNEHVKPSFTNLNKAVEELKTECFGGNSSLPGDAIDSLSVTNLDIEPKLFTIDEHIGLNVWGRYLTKTQKDFINRKVVGAERLEGAAGSGKTISLVLKCIKQLSEHSNIDDEFHIIFLTHSIASKKRTEDSFCANCVEWNRFLEKDGHRPKQSILITTLQEWSSRNLGTNSIEETEFLDKDASDSKIFQLLYIQQAIAKVYDGKWNGYSVICSDRFRHFMQTSSQDVKNQLFTYEVSVIIKGRANGSFDVYNRIERPKLSLPLEIEADRMFSFEVYEEYQNSLEKVGLFDTDDITLSALGQINTPIWRRRSVKDGFDLCVIDETQLFNLNELSVFHLLNKPEKSSHIIYAIDKTQTFGEVGFNEDDLVSLIEKNGRTDSKLETIFRSSPENVNLAFNILASNMAVFTNFENPLDMCSTSFTSDDEEKCVHPQYKMFNTDEEMLRTVIEDAEYYHTKNKIDRGNILITTTTPELSNQIESIISNSNKTIVRLKGKNDLKSLQNALNKHSFVLSEIDLIGGLEFDAVFIVGVDKGRVPPESESATGFVKYAWHNRMYVAVTRGKYCIIMYGNANKGLSAVIESAVHNDLITLSGYAL